MFEKKRYTMEELLQALAANWSGNEAMRQDFLNAPKYGNDDDFADDWAVRFLVGLNKAVDLPASPQAEPRWRPHPLRP